MNDFRERATATRPALDARTKARVFGGAALTIGGAILAAVAAVVIGGLVADQLAAITAALQAATAR